MTPKRPTKNHVACLACNIIQPATRKCQNCDSDDIVPSGQYWNHSRRKRTPKQSAPRTRQPDMTIVKFGKYNGHTVGFIQRHDPSYFCWMTENTGLGTRIKERSLTQQADEILAKAAKHPKGRKRRKMPKISHGPSSSVGLHRLKQPGNAEKPASFTDRGGLRQSTVELQRLTGDSSETRELTLPRAVPIRTHSR